MLTTYRGWPFFSVSFTGTAGSAGISGRLPGFWSRLAVVVSASSGSTRRSRRPSPSTSRAHFCTDADVGARRRARSRSKLFASPWR
ncbi:MAG: hypothetical protein IPH86_19420 [bacterium]|nr:hypothetical protein [bacterium]